MKVSIITVVYNGGHCIKKCIDSVIKQTYPDIEYIIVDGNSKDDTLSIVNQYRDQVDKVISEPDKGIYDAMNKGIQAATGELIGILNADDEYATSDIIEEVVKTLRVSNTDALYGNLEYVKHIDDTKYKTVRKWISGTYKEGDFLLGWMPPHPTFFVKKHIYTQYGTFRLDLGSAADYELMLRFIHKHKISLTYLNRTMTLMTVGGVSNRTLKNRIEANKNDRKSWKVNNLEPNLLTLYLKPLRKVLQFLI